MYDVVKMKKKNLKKNLILVNIEINVLKPIFIVKNISSVCFYLSKILKKKHSKPCTTKL
jgi:hypothetical protein